MKISIFGLGYVGSVSAACLANDGHRVIGVDPIQVKTDMINNGKTPIIEKDIGPLTEKAVQSGQLSATEDTQAAINASDISFICVGTPSQLNGNLDLKYVRRVCENIGEALKAKSSFHLVVVRSTVLPGTMRNVVIPILEECSGKTRGKDFGVCHNPEFLREGTAVYDYFHPPKTVIGQDDETDGDMLAAVYEKLNAPMIRCDIEISEMVKYVDNVWHALKIGFANEIGNFCKEQSIDSHKVMNIFCQDKKLNISPFYLKPGFAFGGSCLPKDIRAFSYKAKSLDLELPVIGSILASNSLQVEKGVRMITAKGKRRIGILGFSFKAGTDDLRESPMVELIERLIGKGFDLMLYDRNVRLAGLIGANKDYILNRIPHISKLMVDQASDVIEHADVIVIGTADDEFETALKNIRPNQQVVDLVRVGNIAGVEDYEGICW
jgi:GDP-mannose 6-dehydrogenase